MPWLRACRLRSRQKSAKGRASACDDGGWVVVHSSALIPPSAYQRTRVRDRPWGGREAGATPIDRAATLPSPRSCSPRRAALSSAGSHAQPPRVWGARVLLDVVHDNDGLTESVERGTATLPSFLNDGDHIVVTAGETLASRASPPSLPRSPPLWLPATTPAHTSQLPRELSVGWRPPATRAGPRAMGRGGRQGRSGFSRWRARQKPCTRHLAVKRSRWGPQRRPGSAGPRGIIPARGSAARDQQEGVVWRRNGGGSGTWLQTTSRACQDQRLARGYPGRPLGHP